MREVGGRLTIKEKLIKIYITVSLNGFGCLERYICLAIVHLYEPSLWKRQGNSTNFTKNTIVPS